MTPDVCMKFLVWSYYYHDVVPQPGRSFGECGLFAAEDVKRLDELKDCLFRCFTAESVTNAVHQFQLAKVRREPCPFTQKELDAMFASEMKDTTSSAGC